MTTRTFWWSGFPGRPIQNFGDGLSPILLERFAGISSKLSTFDEADLVVVGSVLQLMRPGWPGVIAGAGKLRANSPFLPSRRTRIVGLRGPLTARGIAGDYAIGDPGLLAPELLPNIPDRRYRLTLIPHWSDRELEHRPEFLRYNPHVVRVSENPIDVIRAIGQSHKVVTSSLHACIIADALGVPRRIEEMKLTRIDTAFKWSDYHESVGMKFAPGKTSVPSYSRVEARTHELHDMFRSLKAVLK